MPWITRGIHEGIVTSRYPHRPDGYGPTFRAAVSVRDDEDTAELDLRDVAAVTELCPTGAIRAEGGRFRVDRGGCIACGRCVAGATGRVLLRCRRRSCRAATRPARRPAP